MWFLRNEMDDDTKKKMKNALLTNSGCEGRFSDLGNRAKVSGRSAPITTISDKQIVSANKFLVSDEFQAADKGNMFKWARTSSEVKEAEKLTGEFLRDVEAAKRQANKAKHMAKHRRCLRAIKLGEECKLHGGPVSGDNLDLLDFLDEGQVTKEVLFLKATIASELKIKKSD